MRALAIGGAVALLSLLGVAGPAGGADADTKTLTAALSAAEETPPGPEGGTGAATIVINMAEKTLCYELSWSKEVGEPNSGHIHKGAKGLTGPTVVNFQLPDKPKDCVKVDGNTLEQIAGDPAGHYVNLHTNAYPTGAVRGQLQEG